jgi:hypothetical protein
VADSTSLVESSPVSGADLKRAEKFAREAFVLEGEDPAVALAHGTARRRALDDALAELDAGRVAPPLLKLEREFGAAADAEPERAAGERRAA